MNYKLSNKTTRRITLFGGLVLLALASIPQGSHAMAMTGDAQPLLSAGAYN